jgi:hypothetical protein
MTREGHCKVPQSHKKDGANLGAWARTQRHLKKTERLDLHRQKNLEEVGFHWGALSATWNEMCALFNQFMTREGHCNVPQWHKEDEANVGTWLKHQRQLKKTEKLDANRQMRPEKVSCAWGLTKKMGKALLLRTMMMNTSDRSRPVFWCKSSHMGRKQAVPRCRDCHSNLTEFSLMSSRPWRGRLSRLELWLALWCQGMVSSAKKQNSCGSNCPPRSRQRVGEALLPTLRVCQGPHENPRSSHEPRKHIDCGGTSRSSRIVFFFTCMFLNHHHAGTPSEPRKAQLTFFMCHVLIHNYDIEDSTDFATLSQTLNVLTPRTSMTSLKWKMLEFVFQSLFVCATLTQRCNCVDLKN